MPLHTILGQKFEFLSWEAMGNDIFSLATNILKTNKHFNRIVAIATGGLTSSRTLKDYLNIAHLSSIQVEFYTNINTTAKTPVIAQSLPVSIKGEKILIFDDIVDTGETMKLAVLYLNQHGAKSISSASLYQKPWTKFKADYIAKKTNAWVIFPHEHRETITQLYNQWSKKMAQTTIKSNLLKLGFNKSEVELFTDLK